jgi:hypothetical protein
MKTMDSLFLLIAAVATIPAYARLLENWRTVPVQLRTRMQNTRDAAHLRARCMARSRSSPVSRSHHT